MHDERCHAERGELAMQMEAARPGFVNHEHLIGQRELFLHEGQEAGWSEPLRRLGRLAIAHPDDTELIGVPVHPELELLDANLRFRIRERICFHRHV